MTPTPFLGESYLTTELRHLLREVTTLREEAESYTCTCSDPDCPFSAAEDLETDSYDEEAEKESPDLGFGSMEMILSDKKSSRRSLPYPLTLVPAPSTYKKRPHTTQSTCNINTCGITCGTRAQQKRADGTILESDYPGWERRKMRSGLSLNYLNRLDVCFNEALEADCQVDQDGITTYDSEEYSFSRQAPERSRVLKVSSKKVDQTSSVSSSTLLLVKRKTSAGPLRMVRHSSEDILNRRHSAFVGSAADIGLRNFNRKTISVPHE